MAAALSIADRVYVMRNGVVVWEGPASELAAHEVSDRYLGAEA